MNKRLIIIITSLIMVSLISITTVADSKEFIDYCKENHTVINTDSPQNNVSINGFENLWNDRSIISDTEISDALTNNESNEDKIYYSLKLNVVCFEPFMEVYEKDAITGEERTRVFPSGRIYEEASLETLCTEANYNAYKTIESADYDWYVISIEKYLIRLNDEEQIRVACDSIDTYNISFTIPSYYEGCKNLKLAKISNGQVSYMEDIDTDDNTFTITAKGSAAYVFSGKKNQVGGYNPTIGEADVAIVTTETPAPSQDIIIRTPIPTDTNNNSGQVTAPQTTDLNNPVVPTCLLLTGAMVLILLRKNKEKIE